MSTGAMDGLSLNPPGRRLLRGGLIGGAFCVAYAALGAAILSFGQLPTRDGAGLFWAVTSVAAGSIAPVMFLLALLSLFVVRAGKRAIARFRDGQALADWRFPPDQWEVFLGTEQARRRTTRRQLGWLGVVFPLGTFGLILTAVCARGAATAIACVAGTVAVTALALCLAKVWADRFDRRYVARVRRNPRVLIGRGAVYCGGGLTLWDVNMTVLQGIRLIPGSLSQLEVTIGPNRALQTVDMVAGVASAASGGAAGGGGAGTTTPVMVPVPVGREDEAAELVHLLLRPPAAAECPVAAAAEAVAESRVPDWAPQPRSAAWLSVRGMSWWAIAAGLWVVGLVLFLLAPKAPGGSGQDYTSVGMAMCTVGFFLWIGGLLAVVVAGLGTLRHYAGSLRS